MINFDKLEIFRIEKLQNLKLEKAQREEWGGELTFLNSSGELSESGASAALETVSPDKKNWSQFYAKSFAQLRFNFFQVFSFSQSATGARSERGINVKLGNLTNVWSRQLFLIKCDTIYIYITRPRIVKQQFEIDNDDDDGNG